MTGQASAEADLAKRFSLGVVVLPSLDKAKVVDAICLKHFSSGCLISPGGGECVTSGDSNDTV